jgi:hypothetical protein
VKRAVSREKKEEEKDTFPSSHWPFLIFFMFKAFLTSLLHTFGDQVLTSY